MKKSIGMFVAVILLAASSFFVSCSDDEDSCEHIWNDGVVTTEPTTEVEGVKTFTCTVCKQSKNERIKKVPETPVDVETGLAPTASTKYVYFGTFPKTVLPESSGITVDETKSIKKGVNTYYKGSDGNYYAKVEENASRLGDYQCYSDGTHAVQKIIGYDDYSSYRYFKVEPIKWKVLTTNYNNTNKALLLAENILTSGIHYYGSSLLRTIDGSRVYGNNYKYSEIRAYLNGKYESADTQSKTAYDNKGFLQTAFSSTAQSIIAETEVDNSKETTEISESKYATKYACENTIDKIFLLSESEVGNHSYGFGGNYITNSTETVRKPTDYAIANYVATESKYVVTEAKTGGRWWLRSPRYDSHNSAYIVNEWGGCYQYEDVALGYCGVVPALCISLE